MNVLDLFCGCGGFSTGFLKAGFKVKYAIDKWEGCKETFEKNHPDTEFILDDIRELNPEDFKNIDIVIGSPPCQNFSVANKSPDAKKGMELVNIFREWIDIIKPKKWIMENVPQVAKHISFLDYPVINILDSAFYGVPQHRKRCFAGDYYPPMHTHIKSLNTFCCTGSTFIVQPFVTVWDVIHDILFIEPNTKINHEPSEWKTIDDQTNKKFMRIHKAVELDKPSKTITAHSYKDGTKHPVFRFEVPNHYCFDNVDKWEGGLFQKRVIDLEKPAPTVDTKWRCNYKIMNSRSFDNRANQAYNEVDRPTQTVTTSPPKITEGVSYRRLTVREVARIQSFEDDFIFYGSMSNQYKMVGNAVPPLMSYNLAQCIFIEEEKEGDFLEI